MQMSLIVLTGYVVAVSPAVSRLLEFTAGLATTTAGAVVLMGLVSMGASWLHWGLGSDRRADLSAIPRPETSPHRLPPGRCGRLSGIHVHVARRPLGFGAAADGHAEELHGGPGRPDSDFDDHVFGVQPDPDRRHRDRHERDAAAALPARRRCPDERGSHRRVSRDRRGVACRSPCAWPCARRVVWLLARRRDRAPLRAEPRDGTARAFRRLDPVRRRRLPDVPQRLQLCLPVRGAPAAPEPREFHAGGHCEARRTCTASSCSFRSTRGCTG